MYFSERDNTGLSRATLDAIGKDVSALADTFMKQADAIWNSMVAAGETKRHGQRYTVERLDGPEGAAFSRILAFHCLSGEKSRVAVVVARGEETHSGRKLLAWAEDSREARSLQAPLKHLSGEFASKAFRDLRETSHCVALSRLVDGEWHNETPLYKYDIRAQMTKYVLDWETPEGSGVPSPV